MHPDILSKEQKELIPLIRQFKREFYLIPGFEVDEEEVKNFLIDMSLQEI
jgi:hypothetical protein